MWERKPKLQMTLSAKQLNRATLGRQLLLHREALEVAEGVCHVMARQAQEAASPYLALWHRLAPFDHADLDAAFTTRTVEKASLMRITLHAVHVDDYPALYRVMVSSLRAARLGGPRFTGSGLTTADLDALLPTLPTSRHSPAPEHRSRGCSRPGWGSSIPARGGH